MVSSKPVILLIDNSIAITGALKCALQQAQMMQKQYAYVFILPKGSQAISLIEEKGFKVYTLPMVEIRKSAVVLLRYGPQLIMNTIRLRNIFKKEGGQVVVMNDFYNLLGIGLKLTQTPVKLITYVRFLPNSIPTVLRRIWLGFAIKYADKIVVVSDIVKSQMPSHPKVKRIYDAVALLEELAPKTNNNEMGVVELLYLGNYIPGKGHNYALSAFKRAYELTPHLRLTFVGGDMGLEKNRQYRQKLESEVKRNRLDDVVTFLPFEKNIEKALKRADIFLNFSESESFSMTCLEASFYGIPTVASKCGGPEEIVLHEETGLLVENRNTEQMANAILRLASSPSLRQKFSVKAKAYVRQKFSNEMFLVEFGELLSNITKS